MRTSERDGWWWGSRGALACVAVLAGCSLTADGVNLRERVLRDGAQGGGSSIDGGDAGAGDGGGLEAGDARTVERDGAGDDGDEADGAALADAGGDAGDDARGEAGADAGDAADEGALGDAAFDAGDGGSPCVRRDEGVEPCATGFVCVTEPGSCGAPGVCARRPEVCGEIAAPVCGCDGRNYANECFARGAGTAVAFAGRCADRRDGSVLLDAPASDALDASTRDAPSDAVVPPPDVPSSCPAGLRSCAGVCVDVQTHVAHCGACGTRCPTPANGVPLCERGLCRAGCASGFGDCDGSPTNGCETNLLGSAIHCGACGTACPAGNVCVGGVCRPEDTCASRGLCATQADCGSTVLQCVRGAPSDRCGECRCPAGQSKCGGACVDLQTDRGNCGVCGRVCPAAQSCVAGVCACPTNTTGARLTLCAGACVDTTTSLAHCGACGAVCREGANATGATCVAGQCRQQCLTGFLNCNGAASDGCEVNRLTSPQHCGTCGNTCPMGALCVAGVCTPPVSCAGYLCGATCHPVGSACSTISCTSLTRCDMGTTCVVTGSGAVGCCTSPSDTRTCTPPRSG